MVCCATRLWHGSDSNVVPMPSRTKCTNFGNVVFGICYPASSFLLLSMYNELLFISNMDAFRANLNGSFSLVCDAAEFDGSEKRIIFWRKKQDGEEANGDIESVSSQTNNPNSGSKKMAGRRQNWREDAGPTQRFNSEGPMCKWSCYINYQPEAPKWLVLRDQKKFSPFKSSISPKNNPLF